MKYDSDNIYFSKKYTDRSHSMFIKLCKENGEDFVVEVLRKIYKTLNQEIQKTLSAYVYGVMKNYKKELDLGNDYTVERKDISYETKETFLKRRIFEKIPQGTVKIRIEGKGVRAQGTNISPVDSQNIMKARKNHERNSNTG